MKKINWLLFALLTGLLLFMFMDSLGYLFPYHEQQHLFLFSSAYLDIYLSEPGQLGEYLTNFVVQFFYQPFIGKITFAFLLSFLYLFPVSICTRMTGKQDMLYLPILVPLYFLIQFESVDFEINRITSLFFSLLLLYSLSFLPKKAAYIAILPFSLLTGLTLGWIYPVAALSICTASSLSAVLLSRFMTTKKIYAGCTILCLGIYTTCTFYLFVHSYDMRERLLIEAENHIQKQEWEQVLSCAKKYKGENQLMDYFRNLALYQTGRMPYDLLNSQQSFGINSLFLSWTGDTRQSRFGHYIYEQLGYLNEAQRWVSESMVVYGETAPRLINLIRYNIANGRPEVAMRFIRKLKQSLFYRKQAEVYEKIAYTGHVPGLQTFPHQEGKKAHFTNVRNVGPELLYICEQDSTNQMAFEYLMSYLLLSNRLEQFAKNLPRIEAFNYPEMPPLYREALERYKQTQH